MAILLFILILAAGIGFFVRNMLRLLVEELLFFVGKLEQVDRATEEFKDFRGKLAFLYEAIGGSFSHDIAYPWVLYLFDNMTVEEVQKLAKEANDFGIGNKLGK